jgi:formate/nitrite transporter
MATNGNGYRTLDETAPLVYGAGAGGNGGIPYSQAKYVDDGSTPSALALATPAINHDGTKAHGQGRETFAPPRLTPFFTFQQALSSGEHKAELHWGKTIVLGLLAGMYISIGALLAINIGGGVPGFAPDALDLPGLQKLLFSIVFPVGLLLVTLSGAELVTSSLALVTLSLLEGTVTLRGLLKNWIVSYVFNFLGCLFFVGLSLQAEIFYKPGEDNADISWTYFAIDVACKKAHLSFQDAFTRGFMCNWLVCLAVYNSGGANTIPGKAMAIWPAIMAFVAMVRANTHAHAHPRTDPLTRSPWRLRPPPPPLAVPACFVCRALSIVWPTCFSSRWASSSTSSGTGARRA